MLRAFFAVEIAAAARQAAARVAALLREAPGGDGVRWVRPESYHLTLRFLGEIEASLVRELAVRAAAEVAPLHAFEARLDGVCALPSPRRPHVIVLGLVPQAPFAELAAALERAARGVGLAAEERRFKAHLTLGRVANRRVPSLDAVAAPESIPFLVSELVLFRSVLGPGGSTYTPLERIALGRLPSHTRTSTGELHGTQ
jgi:2'-5' RNA ligase